MHKLPERAHQYFLVIAKIRTTHLYFLSDITGIKPPGVL